MWHQGWRQGIGRKTRPPATTTRLAEELSYSGCCFSRERYARRQDIISTDPLLPPDRTARIPHLVRGGLRAGDGPLGRSSSDSLLRRYLFPRVGAGTALPRDRALAVVRLSILAAFSACHRRARRVLRTETPQARREDSRDRIPFAAGVLGFRVCGGSRAHSDRVRVRHTRSERALRRARPCQRGIAPAADEAGISLYS